LTIGASRPNTDEQDFLGPTPQAKAFIDKYISYRFPSIPAPTPSAPPSLKTNSQPTAAGATSRGNSKPASKVGTPSATGYSGHDRDLGRAVSDAFAFGPSGTVYNKNALADAGSSRGGSGSNTPQFRQPGRSGGALTIHEAKAKDKGKGKAAATGGSGGSGGGKGDKIWDVPKSREVKRLEGLKGKMKMVQDGEKVKRDDEVPDCFCQGTFSRAHLLRDSLDRDSRYLDRTGQAEADVSPHPHAVDVYTPLPALRPRPLHPSAPIPALSELSSPSLLASATGSSDPARRGRDRDPARQRTRGPRRT